MLVKKNRLIGDMSEDQEKLRKEIVKALEKNTSKDYIAIALKTSLSNVPVVGGMLVELMDSFIPESKAKRLLEFVAQLRIDVDRIQNRINKEYVKTDEFAYLFEQTFRAVNENYQKEKIEAFRSILVNSLINTNVKSEEKELILNTVKNLTVRHIKLLKMFSNPEKYVQENRIQISNYSSAATITIFNEIFIGYDDAQIRLILNDLYNMGLTNLDTEQLNTQLSYYGLDMVKNRLMPFGRSLVRFISSNYFEIF